MRLVFTVLLVTALAACADDGPTTPAQFEPPSGSPALAPFQDALERIVPSLSPGAGVEGVRSALTAVLEQGNGASLSALEAALDHLITEQPDAAVEADAIRLAMSRR